MTSIKTLAAKFWNDQHGFIVSAELILVATIVVLAMVVGLSEISVNINNELEDVGTAFGSMSQSYSANGLCGHGGKTEGSRFNDCPDFCDYAKDIQSHGGRGE